ncbi:MAG TPA: undecaprenyldiphospho-muramoylpentapeptide beta-N-acetylglucosaminyltransferase [Candidatus Limiplasma sp.]|nr:undecaprenyldiphospho-muramoylpentapeptide beta-N-acetylglucosaminyltransferase [Candidatus Limiplasma sp.]HRX09783.1 undecaprenyldiphospho-muramoylpentapeptide beta-N-acetylglucosaminyltransferase [Candidatus Limiplasma sp.]
MKRIVLTGGGTAGHVSPHLGLIPRLRQAGYELHYIGRHPSIEYDIIHPIGDITFHPISAGKLRRYFSLTNFTDIFRVLRGIWQSYWLLRKLKPDVCFSKGGFVSIPVVIAAHLNHVPIVCHESDMTPGLANRIAARFADRIATTFPECAACLGGKGIMTGTPLREDLFDGSRERGFALAGFDGAKPVLLVTGGSQGAQAINQALRESLERLLPEMDILHLCGKGNLDESLLQLEGYRQFEYLQAEWPDVLAAADLVLSRAGANALSELLALKKPMLLVPYPLSASRGDQIKNADSFERQGFARVLPQETLTPETLTDALKKLTEDQDTLTGAMNSCAIQNGTDAVLKLIEDVQTRRQ